MGVQHWEDYFHALSSLYAMFRQFIQRCDTFSHYKYRCCLRFLLRRNLCFWMTAGSKGTHASLWTFCNSNFSFDCIYLTICISSEVLQKCLWEVTEPVGGQETRISDHVTKFTFFTFCIVWGWNRQVSIQQSGMVGITVIWKNPCLPSTSYCRWGG